MRFQDLQSPDRVGEITHRSEFSSSLPSCLDMPIKFPKGDIRLPYTNKAVSEFVARCIEYEKSINPDLGNYYCYLTIDQRTVKAGSTHRNPGAHFDGMQGVEYLDKLPADHSYIVCDFNPTHFYNQNFDPRNLDMKWDNWFKELSKQIDDRKLFIPNPFEIYLMSAYQMHTSPVIPEIHQRTLMRMEFSLKKFNRVGNTINPLLKTEWKYIPRPIPKHLV